MFKSKVNKVSIMIKGKCYSIEGSTFSYEFVFDKIHKGRIISVDGYIVGDIKKVKSKYSIYEK